MQLTSSTLLQGGKYRIEKVLGQGGFGITYMAVQTGLNRKVAIKEFFMKEYCNRDGETSQVSIGSEGSKELVARFRLKFIKEAQTIAGLNHPHIIRIHDIFEENGTAYYVMEYHDHGSLSELIKQRGSLPEAEALRYIREMADALGYIHEHQMNHLDVKPGNVLLDEKGRSVLIDFGLSKRYDESGQQTSTTPVGISHGYAPMEQYKQGGVETFSPATDIYSLGATFYKLLTGQTPPDASDVFTDGLPTLPVSVSSSVVNAITQAMSPNKKNRPQSVEAFLSLLEKEPLVVDDDDEETKFEPIKPDPKPTPAPIPQPQPTPQPAPQPMPTSSKKKWLLPALVTVVVALIVLFWPKGSGEEPALPIADTLAVETVVVEDSVALDPIKEETPTISSRNVAPPTKTATKTPSSSKPTVKVKSLEEIYDEAMTYYRKKDYAGAIPLLKDAANKGHVDAQLKLGYCYDEGLGVSKDDYEANKWYRKAAEQGSAAAQYNLGYHYQYGEGIDKDYSEAVKWYRKAAEQGDADAQLKLGYCYDEGLGVSKDDYEANKWYRKAAEQGNAQAQFNLGYNYYHGEGVSQDYSEAVKWYRKAAGQGYIHAQHNLGVCYERGRGIPQDYSEAVRWYRKAAEQGNATSQHNLGYCYDEGLGVPKDYSEAVKWYRKAAEQGNVNAQHNLGLCYYYGTGVGVDKSEALKWLQKAGDKGHNSAKKFINEHTF